MCVCVFSLPRTQTSAKKDEKKCDKPCEKDGKDASKKQESKSGKSDAASSSSTGDASKKDDKKKHGKDGERLTPSSEPSPNTLSVVLSPGNGKLPLVLSSSVWNRHLALSISVEFFSLERLP